MSDLDIWEEAFKTMKLNESVQFVSRGRLITEASQVEMFNKIQALLNADGMESCHKWLYEKDPTELTEAEASKINNLYQLGIERGMIEDPTAEEPKTDEEVVAVEEPVAPTPVEPTPSVPTSAYTVLYSAMRNGEIKTGEAYSNSINPRSAKADVISQLERAGYSNVKILAIECGDPDECGNECNNTFCKQAEVAPEVPEIPDYSEDAAIPSYESDEEIEEADDKDEEKSDDKEDSEEDSEEADDSKSADDNDEEKSDDSADDKDEEKSDDKEDSEEADDKDDDKKEEDAEEPDEKLKDDADDKAEKASDKEKEDKELDANEKASLKDSYKKAFKAAMQKCKFYDKSFDDLSLEEKVQFFTELNKAWGSKADPSKFMSDKETEQLESIVVKK